MVITVNTKKIKLDKAVKLVQLPELIGVHFVEEDKENVFLSDNNKMIYKIPEDAMTEDGHKYVVFHLSAGG